MERETGRKRNEEEDKKRGKDGHARTQERHYSSLGRKTKDQILTHHYKLKGELQRGQRT